MHNVPSPRKRVKRSDNIRHGVSPAILRFQKGIGLRTVQEGFGTGIEIERRFAGPIRHVGQVDEAGAVMRLLYVGVRFLATPDAIHEIRLMPFVREIPFVLRNDLTFIVENLPPAAVPAQIHQLLCSVDFDPAGA